MRVFYCPLASLVLTMGTSDMFDTDTDTARLCDVIIANQNNFAEYLWMLGMPEGLEKGRDRDRDRQSRSCVANGVRNYVKPHTAVWRISSLVPSQIDWRAIPCPTVPCHDRPHHPVPQHTQLCFRVCAPVVQ